MNCLVIKGGDSDGVFEDDDGSEEAEEADQGQDEGCPEEEKVPGVILADLRTWDLVMV